jgi:uncharacterized protein (TIGR00369 family)
MNLTKLNDTQRARIERAIAGVPFARLLGVEIESIEPGHSVILLKIREELKQYHGVLHGGAIASLIDTAMALAILPELKEDERTTTVDLTVNYLRPLSQGTARADARIVRAGRTVIALTAEVFDEDGKLAATSLSTYLRIKSSIDQFSQ